MSKPPLIFIIVIVAIILLAGRQFSDNAVKMP